MSTPRMAVTRHPPIREQIADILRKAIVTLEFQPGLLLVERELCELTGASRPSVREALRQLEAEGLVESKNGRGTVVRVLTTREIGHLYEVRAQLEGLAARLFSERADDALVDRLRGAVDRMATSIRDHDEGATVLDAQGEYYAALFEGADNPELDRMIQGLQVRVAQLRALTLAVPGRAEESLAEFQRVVEAITRRDPIAAERAAVAHVERAGIVMDGVSRERTEPAAEPSVSPA